MNSNLNIQDLNDKPQIIDSNDSQSRYLPQINSSTLSPDSKLELHMNKNEGQIPSNDKSLQSVKKLNYDLEE